MNSGKLGFVCGFDMSIEVSHFKRMPAWVQSSAERHVVETIYESFVIPGDQDYLMSRLLALKGLPRGFYWAAAQAIEKYLKAFLLMNGIGVRNFQCHRIKKIFEESCKVDSDIAEIQVFPHSSIYIEPSILHCVKKFTIQEFIAELDLHGKPGNRYNAEGVDYNTGHLFAMDSAAFQLRQRIGVMPPIAESLRKVDNYLVDVFELNNPFFQPGTNYKLAPVPSKEFPVCESSSVARLQFIKNNQSDLACKISLDWLDKKMKI